MFPSLYRVIPSVNPATGHNSLQFFFADPAEPYGVSVVNMNTGRSYQSPWHLS